MCDDSYHCIAGEKNQHPIAGSRDQQQPANGVAHAANNQRSETGVRHRRNRSAHVRDCVVRLEVTPRQGGQDSIGDGYQHHHGPQAVDEARTWPSSVADPLHHPGPRHLALRTRWHSGELHDRRRRADAYSKPTMPRTRSPSRACGPPQSAALTARPAPLPRLRRSVAATTCLAAERSPRQGPARPCAGSAGSCRTRARRKSAGRSSPRLHPWPHRAIPRAGAGSPGCRP